MDRINRTPGTDGKLRILILAGDPKQGILRWQMCTRNDSIKKEY